MSRKRSVQVAHLGVETIEGDALRLAGGQERAVLEVSGVNFGLMGEAEQEAIVASYAAFLNSLSHPIQYVIRVVEADMEGRVADFECQCPPANSDELAELRRDYIALLRQLGHRETLLERHFYLVVPGPHRAPRARRLWPFGRPSPQRADASAGDASRELNRRCAETARDLGRAGLTVRRLEGAELTELLYECWCPEPSRIQRFRRDLSDYTRLVVRGAPRNEGRP